MKEIERKIKEMKRLENMILDSTEIKRVIDEFGYETVVDYVEIIAIEEDYTVYDMKEAFYKDLWSLEEALEVLSR